MPIYRISSIDVDGFQKLQNELPELIKDDGEYVIEYYFGLPDEGDFDPDKNIVIQAEYPVVAGFLQNLVESNENVENSEFLPSKALLYKCMIIRKI